MHIDEAIRAVAIPFAVVALSAGTAIPSECDTKMFSNKSTCISGYCSSGEITQFHLKSII
jgi:hypothetical protein